MHTTLTHIIESSDIPVAPKVARKPHTTGATTGATNGFTNNSVTNGATKTLDPAATNPTAGFTVS